MFPAKLTDQVFAPFEGATSNYPLCGWYLIDVLIQNDDRVLGIAYRGIAKAYPIRILNWHEIVNDSFAGYPVTVTYCPLCNSGIAYDAVIKD
jgi:uncharacterized protein DUF3179